MSIGRLDRINTRYGSIWDELPYESSSVRKVPETQDEALELVKAAESSMTRSTMQTWDAHNDMVQKSAELRKIQARKQAIESQYQEHREEQRELMAKIAIENAQRRERFLEAKE